MNTKYPIVLVHGLTVRDTIFFKSFGKIDKKLKEKGYTVYRSQIDSFGTIENNAQILKEEILKIIDTMKCDKVNIIAHSKGGLDSKYMIMKLDMEDKVSSLTTLCTPHKGSPIATNILKLPKWILKTTAFFINTWYKILGDKHPDSLNACIELSESNAIEEETFDISNKVYCQSYSTKMDKPKDDFIMGIPLLFFHHFEKDMDSDGLVSSDSAVFGEYKGNAFKESISHSEINGFSASKKKREKVYEFYYELCRDLASRGY